MFEIRNGQTTIEYSRLKFSGGEVQVKLSSKPLNHSSVYITAHLQSSDNVMELVMLVDALRRSCEDISVHLVCPYLPYARQDRVCAEGESLALKAMCGIINSLNFKTVTVWDVHSDVALALLDNVKSIPQKAFVPHLSNCVLVAPDAGAMKKISEASKELGVGYIRADKVRDVQTGAITGTVVYSDPVGDKDFLIVDDICDGGRTFLELAKVLRPLTTGKVMLYVTHGIFSNGLDVFDGIIDGIYVANPFIGVDLNHKLIEKVGKTK